MNILITLKYTANLVHIPFELLRAVCTVESNLNPLAVNLADGDTPSIGLCQVKLSTANFMDHLYHHKFKATVKRLKNPTVNAVYAAEYLKWQLKRYKGNLKKAISAYNRGYSSKSNKRYVHKVLIIMKGIKRDRFRLKDQEHTDGFRTVNTAVCQGV